MEKFEVYVMKMLITNLEGQCLFDVSIETQAEGLITLHEGKHKKTDLEDYLKGGEIKIESTDPCEACEKIADIIKGAKKHGKVFIAFDGRGLGPLLNFVANHVGVDGIFTCYKTRVVRIPILTLDLSPAKIKILNNLVNRDLTALQIAENVKISRAMVYKHIKQLLELGLVDRSKFFEKYAITQSGKLAITG
jgi:CRISPR-associated protein Csa3